MGICQSTAAVPADSSHPQGATKEKSSDSSSPRNIHWPLVAKKGVKMIGVKKATTEHIKKGYSSGASSSRKKSHKQHCNHRLDSSDLLGLEEMKTALLTDGTLSTNVVRMETPFGKAIEQVYDGVHDGEILGSGISGVVRLIAHKVTGVKYAVKCLDVGLVKDDAVLEQMRDEINIMLQLDHPNIVRLEEVYESTNEIYIVQELCSGGDLFLRLHMLPENHYSEAQCSQLVKQMLSAVRYLHFKNIVHRDLKLENFLFSSPDADSDLRMIDFGLSRHFQYGTVLHDAVGTPYTVAPEVIRGSYDEKCDMWSIGVLTYLLLCGETPFGGCQGEPLVKVRDNIVYGELKFLPKDTWALVSDSGKAFVRVLLNREPKRRPSAELAQRHIWFSNENRKRSSNVLDPNVVVALIHFKELSDMRKLLSEVLSYTLLPEQIKGLRDEFEKIDVHGDGEISLSALKQVLMKSARSHHLGALTEQEVEEIFNALRVGQKNPKIRWHEFIAAGLSQCKVDDRNLKRAFDRLDTGNKGYIIFDDLVDLIGSVGMGNRAILELAWKDGMSQCVCCDRDQITYDDFVVIMKGQAPAAVATPSRRSKRSADQGPSTSAPELPTVDEATDLEEIGTPELSSRRSYVKQGSRSMSEKGSKKRVADGEEDGGFSAGRGILHAGCEAADVHDVIADSTMSPLVVNRAVYRTHGEMRLAILEASKRFEEDCARRAHARRIVLGATNGSPTISKRARLVMRRGSFADWSDLIKDTCVNSHSSHQDLLDASECGGRPCRHQRKKSVSDVTGMLSGASAE